MFLSLCIFATVIVDPSRFILIGEPGVKLTQSINIINASTNPVDLTAVLYDWELNEEGKLEEMPIGTLVDSLGSSIKFSPKKFSLNPGQAQVVRFTVEVPTDATEHKGIVFFEEEIPVVGNQSGATVTTKIGATIYVAPENATLAFELLDTNVVLIGDGVYFLVEAVNKGTAHIRFGINYKLQTKSGMLLKEDTYSEQVLFPGKTSKLYYPVAILPSGDYRLALEFNFTGFTKTHNQAISFTLLGDNQ